MLSAAQATELDMLKECLRICSDQGIRHFLLGGSALGAVRHAGFIPWDDDIDVGMPRTDYDRFLSVAQAALPADRFLQTDKTDPSFPFAFSKIRESTTSWADEVKAPPSADQDPQVDVFPLDGCPKNSLKRKTVAASFMLYKLAIFRRLGRVVRDDDPALTRLVKGLATRAYAATFSLESLRARSDRLVRAYGYDECEVVINWSGTWFLREAVPREFFGEGRAAEFEGVRVRIPSDYDGYLRSLYGDYMTPPSIGKRFSPHRPEPIDAQKPSGRGNGGGL